MIVGPAPSPSGGVAQYVEQQRDRLNGDFQPRIYDVGTPSGDGLQWFTLAFLVSLRAILLFPFQKRPDIVHVHSSHGFSFYRESFFVLFAALIWRLPVVLHVHGSSFDRFVLDASMPVRWYQSIVCAAADRIIVLSEYWQDVLAERASEKKIAVIPNAVDSGQYNPEFDGSPHVVFVSNHIERKGIVEFTEAVEKLKREGDLDFRVSIAGDGPLSKRSRNLAERYDDVEYHGYVTESKKRRLLNDASIYVLPTHGEGLPFALLEGMAGGNAIVTTGVGSIPEVIGSSNGTLVTPGDSDELRAALRDMIATPESVEKMSQTNHEVVRDQYSWSMATEELQDMYRSMA